MKIAAVILARMSSRRLPGKMLRKLAGRPLIDHVIDRACRIRSVAQPVIATSDESSDDCLAAHCEARPVDVFRGALDNAARRVRDCAVEYGWDYFARINGDSPFLDPDLIERGLGRAIEGGLDLVTNLQPRTYPYGVTVEVFAMQAYQAAFARMSRPEDLEHVSAFFYRHLAEFRYVNLVSPNGNNADVHLTIDDEADLVRAEALIRGLGPGYDRAGLDRIVTTYRAGIEAEQSMPLARAVRIGGTR